MYYEYGFIKQAKSIVEIAKKLIQNDKHLLRKFLSLENNINNY